MPISPERWRERCEDTNQTHKDTLRIVSEVYESYKNAKSNYDEAMKLTSQKPEIQVQIDKVQSECKIVLEKVETLLRKSLQNLQESAELMRATEEIAMALSCREN
jgi:hypothetical protein